MKQKTLIDDAVLDSMIAQSQYGNRSNQDNVEPEYWFSRNKQKQHIFNLGMQFMEFEGMTPEKAITDAKDFVDTFHKLIINPESWKK